MAFPHWRDAHHADWIALVLEDAAHLVERLALEPDDLLLEQLALLLELDDLLLGMACSSCCPSGGMASSAA